MVKLFHNDRHSYLLSPCCIILNTYLSKSTSVSVQDVLLCEQCYNPTGSGQGQVQFFNRQLHYAGVPLAFKGRRCQAQKFLNRHFIEVLNSYRCLFDAFSVSSNTFVDAQYYVRVTFAQIFSLRNIDIFFISSTEANYPREPLFTINSLLVVTKIIV